MMMAKTHARLARAVLDVGAGRMRNRNASCMSLARATCIGIVLSKGPLSEKQMVDLS